MPLRSEKPSVYHFNVELSPVLIEHRRMQHIR
jgi:hypothetical protein